MMWGWGWGGWVFMSLMMVLFWGLIVFGVIALFRYSARGHDHSHLREEDGGDQAQRILDERFARGEIDADEYAKRRDILRTR